MDGKCTEKVTKEKDVKKTTKKKKKKKGTSNVEPQDDIIRIQYPWYHILAPLTLAIVTYKYSQPTLVTSAIMTLVIVVIGLL